MSLPQQHHLRHLHWQQQHTQQQEQQLSKRHRPQQQHLKQQNSLGLAFLRKNPVILIYFYCQQLWKRCEGQQRARLSRKYCNISLVHLVQLLQLLDSDAFQCREQGGEEKLDALQSGKKSLYSTYTNIYHTVSVSNKTIKSINKKETSKLKTYLLTSWGKIV